MLKLNLLYALTLIGIFCQTEVFFYIQNEYIYVLGLTLEIVSKFKRHEKGRNHKILILGCNEKLFRVLKFSHRI